MKKSVLGAFLLAAFGTLALRAQDPPAPAPPAPADKPADPAPAASPAAPAPATPAPGTPTEKPADKPTEKPADKPAEKPVQPPVHDRPRHPIDPPTDKPVAPPEPTVPGFETLEKKVGYALGTQVARGLKQQGVGAGDLDYDAFARGLRDHMEGVAQVVSDNVLQHALMEFQKAVMARMQKQRLEKTAKNKKEGADFLEKNKTAEGVKVTNSGLQYKCVKEGNGQRPALKDTVVVHYEGKLLDGTVFDSSYNRGAPATFGLQQVIKGWTEGLQLMDVGSTYLLYIPSELAYGPMGSPPNIGPDAVLIFKVEIQSIKK